MTLALDGQKVVVTGGKRELDRTIAQAGADEGADVVIWIRAWGGDVNELKHLLLKMEAQVVKQQPNECHYIPHFGARQCGHKNPTGSAKPALTVA
jgi:NAD(P)-dependent dehydrogenase (short-subunit alcohol dehydrogenase family)